MSFSADYKLQKSRGIATLYITLCWATRSISLFWATRSVLGDSINFTSSGTKNRERLSRQKADRQVHQDHVAFTRAKAAEAKDRQTRKHRH